MNEQTPPTPSEPTEQATAAEEPTVVTPPEPAKTLASAPTPRGTLIAGGAVIAVICGLVGYQLGDNNSSDVDQRVGGPGRGWGNQGQMMPPGQPGQQGQNFQGPQGQGGQRDNDDDDGGQQSGPPMSGAS